MTLYARHTLTCTWIKYTNSSAQGKHIIEGRQQSAVCMCPLINVLTHRWVSGWRKFKSERRKIFTPYLHGVLCWCGWCCWLLMSFLPLAIVNEQISEKAIVTGGFFLYPSLLKYEKEEEDSLTTYSAYTCTRLEVVTACLMPLLLRVKGQRAHIKWSMLHPLGKFHLKVKCEEW